MVPANTEFPEMTLHEGSLPQPCSLKAQNEVQTL